MRVVLYVLNDLAHDGRVRREAASLAGAGHEVTVMATTGPGHATGTRSVEPGGFDVIHVAVPRHYPIWFVWAKHPWRLGRRALAELHGSDEARPRPGRALAFGALTLISIPWIVLRGAWDTVDRLVRGRPARPGVIDYVLRWRVFHLGWARSAVARAPRADVHHASDMDTLPAALAAARRDGARVIYDSHEIYLESSFHARQPGWLRWVMRRWERSMASRTAALVTINVECAAELGRRLQPRRTVVVHSCPPRWTPPAVPDDRIRAATGIPPGAPIVLCHGGFQERRGIEETAAALSRPELRDAHLVLLGRATPVVDRVAAAFPDPDRLHVLPAVDPDEVVAWVAGADVDVMILLPGELNHWLSTPNKLFESIAAGTPVVSSDFPARRRIVAGDPDGPLGELCDPTDPDAVAGAIRRILDLDPAARADLRRRCLLAGRERWNWETEGARLVELYASLEPG
jgi:glycosyltransferase involved in cell wall biosynthesis